VPGGPEITQRTTPTRPYPCQEFAVSLSRRAGRAAYKTLINAIPDSAVAVIDNPLTRAKVSRAHTRDLKDASLWGERVKTPSAWYATDGSHRFYLFDRRKTHFLPGWHCFGRLATTAYGENAAAAYLMHEGQLTDRRPAGWQSIATISAINIFDGHGSLKACGWESNRNLDLDIDEVDRIRAQFQVTDIRESLHKYAEPVKRAMERV
jgi:hypothetical protein